ncbi:MAG: LysR family transcriptional regulator [Actinomycetota bacterium]
MDLRQLDALVAVAEHHSFSAAARALHTVQSNVSSHVAKLERELAAELVDRERGQLTPAGELVVERARRVRAELHSLANDLASVQGEVAGTVQLGLIGTTGRWMAPELIRRMNDEHPGVELIVVEATTTGLLPQLRSGRIELAVVNLPLVDPDFVVEVLFDEELVCVAPDDHPLAARDALELTDLGHHDLLLGPPGNAVRDVLDRSLEELGIELRPLAQIDGVRLMATLAFEGYAPTVVPATAVPRQPTGAWRVVPIHGAPRRRVGLARNTRALPSAPGRALDTALRETLHHEAAHQPGIHPVGVTNPELWNEE